MTYLQLGSAKIPLLVLAENYPLQMLSMTIVPFVVFVDRNGWIEVMAMATSFKRNV